MRQRRAGGQTGQPKSKVGEAGILVILHILILIGGLLVLWGGAEFLVKGSSRIAVGFGVRPAVVGLTIVAMGTSSPEFAVSLFAALTHAKDLSLANIIGSNIANIGLVVGVSAMIKPIKIKKEMFRSEMPILLLSAFVFSLLCWDGVLGRIDGAILLAGFIIFLLFMVRRSLKDRTAAKRDKDFKDIRHDSKMLLLQGAFIILGLAGLVAGSYLIVESAKQIATHLGVSPFVIGISMVAVGTSLPELAISAVGVAREEHDLAVGNAVGSNIFNTLFVIAAVSLITPIPVAHILFNLQFPAMVLFSLVIVLLVTLRRRTSRYEGAALFIAYVFFIFLQFH